MIMGCEQEADEGHLGKLQRSTEEKQVFKDAREKSILH